MSAGVRLGVSFAPSSYFEEGGERGSHAPAHVNWKRFSFSNFLKTDPLISTNWFDRSSVKSAFEYELTATLSVMSW